MAFSTTPTNRADRLRATADNQTINALGGNDWLFSDFNASTLFGGNGHDRFTVILDLPASSPTESSRSATLFGGNGNDWMVTEFTAHGTEDAAFDLSSRQSGGRGDDTIFLSAAATSAVYGVAGSVDFEVFGGAGADNIWIEVSGADVENRNVVGAGSGADIVYVAALAGDEFGSTINVVEAGAGDDDVLVSASTGWLASRASENTLSGGAGNDRLEAILGGAGGRNSLDGGTGDDTLIATSTVGTETGGWVTSLARGGAGNDTILLESTSRGAYATARHTAYGDGGDDVITSIIDSGGDYDGDMGAAEARLYGGAGDDVLTATTRFGPHDAGEGGARLYGGAGNDILRVHGGTENILDGGSGRDRLIGGSGADRLIGGGGADRLTGGAGGDVFVFASVSGASVRTRDAILDFGVGADRIDVSAIDADIGLAGDQAFTFGAGPGRGALWIEAGGGSTSLVKADVGGPALLVIAVRNGAGHDWSAEDFVL